MCVIISLGVINIFNFPCLAKSLFKANGFDVSDTLFHTPIADMVTKGICISMVCKVGSQHL